MGKFIKEEVVRRNVVVKKWVWGKPEIREKSYQRSIFDTRQQSWGNQNEV